MRWSSLRKMAISLPMGVLAALLLVGINEGGYLRSRQAVDEMVQTNHTRAELSSLLQNILDAETGVRGYLLTGEERYRKPYEQAVATVNSNLDKLREQYSHSPDELIILGKLSNSLSRKLSEMDLSIKLRRRGNEDAWRFVMFTDVGAINMDAIRQFASQLIERSNARTLRGQEEIHQSLMLSRLGIATVAVIGLLAFYMYLRQTNSLQIASEREQEILQKERARLADVVRERTATLTELANHLQQVREDERGHLARELHDELGALLTAAKLDVARIKSRAEINQSPEIMDRLNHLTEALNSGIALKRQIIEDLRPSSLSNLGLAASLEILTREFADRSAISIELNLEPVDIPEPTQLTVYRMVQEALTNIGKYAGAKNALVTVRNYPSHVFVQIRDDGEGFEVAAIGHSAHGLAGMRHRVEAAGGRLTVDSTPGEGTQISAVIPIQAQTPDDLNQS